MPAPASPSSPLASPLASLASPSSTLPAVSLPVFEGPLDVLLHYVREHKIAIEDIPIVQVTDYYLAYLRALEAMNLAVAGEFLVMAATLLEMKSRTLLPRPPREETPEEDKGEDPRTLLVQRLLDYQRYKTFVDTLAGWEDSRRQLFFRGAASYGDLYELPTAFGALNSQALLSALHRLLSEAGADGGGVTSVRRQKVTLRLAMAALWRTVQAAGTHGLALEDCFERPLVRFEIVMTFLALLELLRQGRIQAAQDQTLAEIWVSAAEPLDAPACAHEHPLS